MALPSASLRAACLVVATVSVTGSCGTATDAPSVAPAPTTTVAATVDDHTHAHGITSADRASDHTGGDAPNRVFSVEVADGTVVGGFPRFEVSVGDLVRITVTSDVDDEVHLHVYNLVVTVHAGTPAVLDLEATVPGVFEAELHHAGFRVFELQVS